MKKIMFPGSFDPFHKGHASLVKKALKIFDEVDIVVSRNPDKNYKHTVERRKQMIENYYRNEKRVKVLINENLLTINFAKQNNFNYILRGFRNKQDFEYEVELAKYNNAIDPNIELIYFFTEQQNQNTSSSLLKEIDEYKEKNHYE
ncbi:pantetheine-phosphate adenylyltransferase [Mesoplasma lactucae]|uniref:Phosphopantetheine adenylyltransferase n=1 Tax=Mesoplasma lactucae ATCC 49193 TaxID=81460 RepID=A0A291IS49_9MOLU|nr:pantetheine-phosphate adenylyltransferase [Mesoplasma lactucae]ATG97574.1 pantetheine-phosphate adenylyltransferase [Mesoplasma lactucae ATCC 49193]ATZ19967.1 phosphopantetheine adenylyltransferase [Mesoplasma lactucae ATCC 49193]MCL8217082.1 Phosphopantetheine adenylyltransferase [Mesoplasma lactucae ATCC 49193]